MTHRTNDDEHTSRTFDLLEQLRSEGWCVVIKALPDCLPFVIEGARSEYDAPCEDQHVGHGKWCCEVQWMRWDESYRCGPSCSATRRTRRWPRR